MPRGALAPELDALSDRLEATVSAYSVNIDKEPELANKFCLKTRPTVLALKNGEVKACFEKEVFAVLIEQALMKNDG